MSSKVTMILTLLGCPPPMPRAASNPFLSLAYQLQTIPVRPVVPRGMADSLPGDFLPLSAEAGQEPTLLVDALDSAYPTIPLGTDQNSPNGVCFYFLFLPWQNVCGGLCFLVELRNWQCAIIGQSPPTACYLFYMRK